MRLIQVALLDELAPGKMIEVLDGEATYAVCNHQGEIHVLDGVCPHLSGPLAAGNFIDGMLVCPYHAWEFSCVTGEYDMNPRVKLKKYPVHIEGDRILIETTESLA